MWVLNVLVALKSSIFIWNLIKGGTYHTWWRRWTPPRSPRDRGPGGAPDWSRKGDGVAQGTDGGGTAWGKDGGSAALEKNGGGGAALGKDGGGGAAWGKDSGGGPCFMWEEAMLVCSRTATQSTQAHTPSHWASSASWAWKPRLASSTMSARRGSGDGGPDRCWHFF